MRKRLALNMPKPRPGSLWQDASSGVLWVITSGNKGGYARRRVGGKTVHTIGHADLWMFYKPVSR